MINFIIKKQFKKASKEMLLGDLESINKQKDNKTVQVDTYNYLDDKKSYSLLNYYYKKDEPTKGKDLIIDIHGGAWIYGDNNTNGLFCMDFADKNYIVTSFTYRLLIDNHNLIDIVHDIFDSINYILKDPNNYGYNKDNISLFGDSAGGHLLLLFLAINNSTELQKIYGVNHIDINIKNVILNHPAPFLLDLILIKKHDFINYLAKRTFNKMMFNNNKKKNILRNNSSIDQIIDSIDPNLNYLLISSNGDRVCQEQAFRLHQLFIDNNIKHDFYFEKDERAFHVYNVLEPDKELGINCNNYIYNFLKSTKS